MVTTLVDMRDEATDVEIREVDQDLVSRESLVVLGIVGSVKLVGHASDWTSL